MSNQDGANGRGNEGGIVEWMTRPDVWPAVALTGLFGGLAAIFVLKIFAWVLMALFTLILIAYWGGGCVDWITRSQVWRPTLMRIPSQAFVALLLGTIVWLALCSMVGQGLLWVDTHLHLAWLHQAGYALTHLLPKSKSQ